jgi:hypothetical protein
VGKGKGGWERKTILALGKLYPRPVPRSVTVSCAAGPYLVPGPCLSVGLAGPRGFPLGTAAKRVGHEECLPPARASSVSCEAGPPGSRARACPMLD